MEISIPNDKNNVHKRIGIISIFCFDGFLKSAFAEMDKDEDGKVTVDEFLKACQAEEDFSKLLSTTAIEIFFEEEN